MDDSPVSYKGGKGLDANALNQLRGMDTLVGKQKRRSKKDKDGRNYVCACQKSYLSYPALYTHIKNKHGGSIPEGTKIHITKKSKRGRPPKVRSEMRSDVNEDARAAKDDSSFKIENLYLTETFLTKDDLRLIDDLKCSGDTDPSQGFQVFEKSSKVASLIHPIIKIINGILTHETLDSSRTVDTIFSLYLYHVSKHVNLKFYLVLCVFFRNLRDCLNEYGYQVINEAKKVHKIKDDTGADDIANEQVVRGDIGGNGSENGDNSMNGDGGDDSMGLGMPKPGTSEVNKANALYCEKETCDYLPMISEVFLLDYIPKNTPEFHFDLTVKIMHEFCRWLFKKNLTKIKISYNN